MTFAISFSKSIQEEGQQDPPKWKCLKGLMGCPRQAIASPVKQRSIQEEEQQDPPKWKCLKGLMGCPRQAIASPVKQCEPSKEET